MTTYWPSITDHWNWKPVAGYVAFEVLGKDDQTGNIIHTFRVHITERYLKYTYGIPDDSDAWAVAKHNAIALGDIAIERASLGQVGADGVILIDS